MMLVGDEAAEYAAKTWKFTPVGKVKVASGICYAKAYFTSAEDADAAGKEVKGYVNGGWFHGMSLGRVPGDDHTDAEGVRWHVVWY